ncbi:MAG: formate/nitrite transporter family protein [Sedimentisphaerales bacterium]|nr:formate/nitrite transporter family protein [Sedimentisphaerales bacterium]
MNTLRRILVVDDDPTVRTSCERIFNDRGFYVETAATAKEGLEQTKNNHFDCVLVDLRIPDMDGMEVVRRTRKTCTHTAVLIITGYGSLDTVLESNRLGVSDYLCKPFHPDELLQAVEQAIHKVSQARVNETLDQVLLGIKENISKPVSFEPYNPQTLTHMVTTSVGVKKAQAPALNIFALGLLAGVYIAFGSALATLAGHDAVGRLGVGMAQILTGSVFSVGLILVVLAGAELFTGNNLMIASVLNKEYGMGRLLNRWALVYLANFAGALLLVFIMYHSGLWKTASNAVGAKAIAIASAKVNLSFSEAFFRGIGCNWLVCLAVWMSLAAREVPGKILAIFFPIMAFVALGFEHCVANMYFIPMGLLLKGTAAGIGFSPESMSALTWGNFFRANLIPVTLGNIVGGALFVGAFYWFVFMRKKSENPVTLNHIFHFVEKLLIMGRQGKF